MRRGHDSVSLSLSLLAVPSQIQIPRGARADICSNVNYERLVMTGARRVTSFRSSRPANFYFLWNRTKTKTEKNINVNAGASALTSRELFNLEVKLMNISMCSFITAIIKRTYSADVNDVAVKRARLRCIKSCGGFRTLTRLRSAYKSLPRRYATMSNAGMFTSSCAETVIAS